MGDPIAIETLPLLGRDEGGLGFRAFCSIADWNGSVSKAPVPSVVERPNPVARVEWAARAAAEEAAAFLAVEARSPSSSRAGKRLHR